MTEVEQQENEVPEAENVEQREDGDEAPEEAAGEDGYERQEEEEVPVQEEVPEPVVEEEPEVPFVPGPLVISEAHENFTLDKKMEDDPTVGYPNPRHIIC